VTLLPPMNAMLFSRCYEAGMSAADMVAYMGFIPDSIYRSAIIVTVYGICTRFPAADPREFARMTFAPAPLVLDRLSAPGKVFSLLVALNKSPCPSCRANKPCAVAHCSRLPQCDYFKCRGGLHLCTAHASKIVKEAQLLSSHEVVQAHDLRGAELEFQAENRAHRLDFFGPALLGSWSAGSTELWLYAYANGPQVLMNDKDETLVVEGLKFQCLEDRKLRRKEATLMGYDGKQHMIKTKPLRLNGEPIGWYAVADRYLADDSADPLTRNAKVGTYLLWGERGLQKGRVLLA